MPSPTIRMMKPTRYVPKDDIAVSGRVSVMHEQAAYRCRESGNREAGIEKLERTARNAGTAKTHYRRLRRLLNTSHESPRASRHPVLQCPTRRTRRTSRQCGQAARTR